MATGFNTISLLDLNNYYEQTSLGGSAISIGFISNNGTYANKDLGTIFTLYNSLGSLYTGTQGTLCGYYSILSGIDIGTLFIKKGTLSTFTNVELLTNGGFTTPTAQVIKPATIPGWTVTMGETTSNYTIASGTTYTTATMPSGITQYLSVQNYNTTISKSFQQSVFITSGNYVLSFYATSRTGTNLYSTTQTFSPSFGSTVLATGLTAQATFTQYTYNISVSTSGSYQLQMNISCSSGSVDSTMLFTGFSLKKISNLIDYSPSMVSGLQLWLDANDSTTLVKSGTNVSQWNDKSGNSRNAINYNVDASIVFYYKFNSGDISGGNLLADYATTSVVYDATIYNGATIDTTTSQFGGGSIKFVGSSQQYVALPSFTTNLNGFSISLWCKGSTTAPYLNTIFHLTNSSSTNDLIAMNASAFYIFNSTGAQNYLSFANVNTGSWNHYAITLQYTSTVSGVDYGNWFIYINGVQVANSSSPNYYPRAITRTTNFFGKHMTNVDFCTGNFDDFRLYNRFLSSTEVSNLYNTGVQNYVSYNATGFNYLPCLQLSSTSALSAPLPANTLSSGMTCFVVFQKTTGSNTYEALISRTNGATSAPFDIWDNGTISQRYLGDGTNNTVQTSSFSIVSSTTPTLMSFTINGSTKIWTEYKNGSSTFTSSAYSYYGDNSNYLYIGSRADGGTHFTGNIGEVLVYNSTLATTDRQNVEGYLAWKWGCSLSSTHPYYNINPIPNSCGLLNTIPTGCVGLYACKWVNNNYKGPILQLRINVSSVDYVQDFYMNSPGTLIGTALGGTGTSFSTWVGSKGGTYGTTVIYVVQWYDQSPTSSTASGKNASQTTTTSQPTFNTTSSSFLIDFGNPSNAFFNLPDNTVPSGNSNYSVIMNHGTTKVGNGTNGTYVRPHYLSSGNYSLGSSQQENSFRLANDGTANNPQYDNYWYYTGQVSGADVASALTTANGKCSTGNVITYIYNSTTASIKSYVNNVATNSSSSLPSRNSSVNYNTIGGTPSGTNGDYFNSQMYHLSIFNTALSSTDRQTMENITPVTVYSGLLSSIPTGCVGLYACNWVNNNYKGPILQLRVNIASVDYIQDFYMDSTGRNIGTMLGGIGTSLSTWVVNNGGTYGTTTMYVVQWYDQSPTSYTASGKNASQSTTSTQPTFNISGNYIDFSNPANSYFTLLDGTIPYNNTSFDVITYHGSMGYLQGCFVACNIYDMRLNSTAYRFEGTGFTALAPANSYASNSVVSFQYDKPNTLMTLYVNGVSKGTQTEPSSSSSSVSNYNCVGSCITPSWPFSNVASNSFNGSMYYLSMFNVLLSSTDRQTMENIYPIQTGLLLSIPSGCQCLYACKWINNNYTGPILQLRIRPSSTDILQDFYINSTGTVSGTSLGGTGVSLSSWITNSGGIYGTTTAYVVKWYDQSGSGNHAMQTTTTKQPVYVYLNNYVDFSAVSNSCLILPSSNSSSNGSTLTSSAGPMTGNGNFTLIYKHYTTTTDPTTSQIFSSGTNGAVDGFEFRYNNSGYNTYINATNLSNFGSYASNNVVSYKFSGITMTGYVNGVSTTLTPSFTRPSTNNVNITIGYNGSTQYASYPLNGQVYHFTIFNTALSDADRTTMETLNPELINANFSSPTLVSSPYYAVVNTLTVPGWTFSDTSKFVLSIPNVPTNYVLSSASLPSGLTQFIMAQTNQGTITMTQTMTLLAGNHTLSFYYNTRPNSIGNDVYYDSTYVLGVSVGSITLVSNLSASISSWQQSITTFNIPLTGSYTITFTFTNPSTHVQSYSYNVAGIILL